MQPSLTLAEKIASRLIERRETIAIAESSTGGLIAAALLAIPGASAYFVGGAVVYTKVARATLLGIGDADMQPAARDRSVFFVGCAARTRAAWRDLGSWGNRRERAERQSLRRSGGARLRGSRRPDRARDDVGNGKRRPAGEYGCFCQARARASLRGDIRQDLTQAIPPLRPSRNAPRRATRRSA